MYKTITVDNWRQLWWPGRFFWLYGCGEGQGKCRGRERWVWACEALGVRRGEEEGRKKEGEEPEEHSEGVAAVHYHGARGLFGVEGIRGELSI